MSGPPYYSDPTTVTSWVKGAIPTTVTSTNVYEADRNKVFIIGRSKITASVLNSIVPPLTKDPPLNTKQLATDQYIYFHLTYEALAGSRTPPSATVTPGPSFLTMVPRYIDLVTLNTVNYDPVPFILNKSGATVAAGQIQPITLTAIGTGVDTKLNYNKVFDLDPLSSSPFYLVAQPTDGITIYKNVSAGRIDSPLDSLNAEVPSVPGNDVYAGVWYKAYSSLADATSETSPNIWHVTNPFKNSPTNLVSSSIAPALTKVQLGAFTQGGTTRPVYVAGSGPPPNYQQSPTATEVFNSAGGNPITLDQGVEMTGYINDIGNVLSNWGMSDIEITFIPYQGSILFSPPDAAAGLNCYPTFKYSGVLEFQGFATTAYNKQVDYVNPYAGIRIPTRGCINNTTVGYLNSTISGGGINTGVFNNCILTTSADCNGLDGSGQGYWYQYCTGSNTCGTNNCFGKCPDLAGKYVPCLRDYSYSTTSTNSTYYSCNPIQPNPPATVASSLVLIIIGLLVVFILLLVLFYFVFFRGSKKEEPPKPAPKPAPKAAPPKPAVKTVPVSSSNLYSTSLYPSSTYSSSLYPSSLYSTSLYPSSTYSSSLYSSSLGI
jgi:hypothetical protein